MHRLSGLFLIFVFFSACGEFESPPVGQSSLPIVYGERDTSEEHMAVVALTQKYYGQHYIFCTGTLISSDIVVTAAHCMSGQSTSSFYVVFGNSMWGSTTERRAIDYTIHPQYSSNQYPYDIAVIELATVAPYSITPIPYLPHSKGISILDTGTDLTYVGFGEDEHGDTGVKLKVVNGLNWVCVEPGGCNIGSGGWACENTICSDQSPGGPCSGDSGGPAFIFRDDKEYLCGVTSYGDQDCAYFGCSTKVDEYEDFLRDFVGGENGSTCSFADQCDSGYCVDGVCCESTCADICKACNVGGSLGQCVVVPNDTPCPDADLCDGTETCQAGACVDGEPLDCSNANKCTGEQCDPATGCLYNHLPDGTNCSNSDLCDGTETCLDGVCQAGTPLDCNDDNPCTIDTCNTAIGCRNTNVADGTQCGGGQCGPGTCSAGQCVAEDLSVCDDGDVCTRDWCNPETGCEHAPFPEGYACGECLMCMDGQCVEAPHCGESGCGCSHASRPAAGISFLLLLIAGLAVRRRR